MITSYSAKGALPGVLNLQQPLCSNSLDGCLLKKERKADRLTVQCEALGVLFDLKDSKRWYMLCDKYNFLVLKNCLQRFIVS